jgi:hypothetical protein
MLLGAPAHRIISHVWRIVIFGILKRIAVSTQTPEAVPAWGEPIRAVSYHTIASSRLLTAALAHRFRRGRSTFAGPAPTLVRD